MSAATPAASRLLCRSLAANSAKTSSRTVATTTTTTTTTTTSSACHPHQQRHHFHTSPPALSRRGRRSPYPNVTAKKMGLLDPEKGPAAMAKYKALMSPDYDDTDVETLARKYTPEQLEALALGERVVAAEDIVQQGRMRNDPYRPSYLDDFSTMRPVLDRRARRATAVDTSAKFMTPDEFEDDFLEWIRELNAKSGVRQHMFDMKEALAMYEEMRSKILAKEAGEDITVNEVGDAMDRVLGPLDPLPVIREKVPDGAEDEEGAELLLQKMEKEQAEKQQEDVPTVVDEAKELSPDKAPPTGDQLEIYKFLTERNSMTGFDGGDSALAPELPKKVPGVVGLYKQEMDEEDAALDPEGTYQELRRQTGMTTREIMEISSRQCKILVRRFVSNQTRLGKIRSTYVLAIAGNKDGRLGLGEAKSVDPETASNKAKLSAIKNMQPIRRYEQRTIYGNVEAKVGGTIVQLFSRPPGMLSRDQELLIWNLSMLTNINHRIRPQSLPPLLRDGPSSGHQRPGSQDATVPQPNELGQSLLPGSDEPA
ncbi:unnamed protein product [Discula destructiva]